jgi:hypothetical protein
MKRILASFLLLAMLAAGASELSAQCTNIGTRDIGVAFSISISGSHRTKWDIYDAFSAHPNLNVATLQRCNGEYIPLGSRERHANCVLFTFNNCVAVGQKFYLRWNTYNWAGGNVGTGCFEVVITQPPVAGTPPVIAFSNISSDCQNVTLCVSNPNPYVSYTWSSPGSPTMGACATYPVPLPPPIPPQPITVTATGCLASNTVSVTQNSPGSFPPGVSLDGPGTVCPNQGVFLTARSSSCVPASNWQWTSTCGTVYTYPPTSGIEALAVFYPDFPGFCTVDVTVTDFQGVVSTATIGIWVLDYSNPECFFFKPGETTNNEAVSEGDEVEERTDGAVKNKPSVMKQLTLSPNPANDVVLINNVTGYNLLRVHDSNGKLVLQTEVPTDQDQYRLNTFNYANGLYFLTLSGPDRPAETVKASIVHD